MTTVEMPQLGETITEGTVIRWLKAPGDAITIDEALCEIETEKVNAEIPSPIAGTLAELLVEEGETVEVGTSICRIEAGPDSPATAAEGQSRTAADSGREPRKQAIEANRAGATSGAEPRSRPAVTSTPTVPARGRFYSPVVLRLAQEHNLELERLTGTGVGGRITRRDIERHLDSLDSRKVPASASEPDGPPLEPGKDYTAVPLTPTRRAISERLQRSVSEAPQAWTMIEVDVTSLLERRAADRPAFEREEGRRLTLLPYFVQAVCRALTGHPELNARWAEGELRRYRSVHCGIAVAADQGLVVPVVHDAQDLSVAGLARRIDDCATRARERRLTIDDVSGGTITVNNTGAFGSIASRPIVNHPEVANITLERVVRRPVIVAGDSIAIRSMVNVCLTFDHRAFDGLEAGRFLATLRDLLEGGSA